MIYAEERCELLFRGGDRIVISLASDRVSGGELLTVSSWDQKEWGSW